MNALRWRRGSRRTIYELAMQEIAEPTASMAASLDALTQEYRTVLVAMLDVPAPPVPERELALAMRRHSVGLEQPISALTERLAHHFLRPAAPASVTWVHPSWRDLVIDRLAADQAGRQAFLETCSLEGVLLAVSVEGGVSGERTFPLLVSDADWDALLGHIGVLVRELGDADRLRLVSQLGVALDHALGTEDQRVALEVDALVTRVLEVIAEQPASAEALAVLEMWHVLCDFVRTSPAPPNVTDLWVDTLPTDDLDLTALADLQRLSVWVSLVTILDAHGSRALSALASTTSGAGWPGSSRSAETRRGRPTSRPSIRTSCRARFGGQQCSFRMRRNPCGVSREGRTRWTIRPTTLSPRGRPATWGRATGCPAGAR